MKNYQLYDDLNELDIGSYQLAELLDVNVRTVNRWLDGTIDTPMSVERVIAAWKALQSVNLPWRPNEIGISPFDINEMMDLACRHEAHRKRIDEICSAVEARGGSALQWSVDLERSVATSGDFHLTFYRLKDGNISPQTFRRSDGVHPDPVRDQFLIEDALYSIKKAI